MSPPRFLPVAALALVLGCLSPLLAYPAPAGAHDEASAEPTHLDSAADFRDGSPSGTFAGVRSSSAVALRSSAGGLPNRWCAGAQPASGPGFAADAPAIQLVYAHVGASADRFGQFANALQGNVSLIDGFIGSVSGGTKTVRFVMSSTCGPQYVDIARVQLPAPRDVYLAGPDEPRVDLIKDELERLLPDGPGARNYLVYVDDFLEESWGEADGILGPHSDRPGSDNPNNDGGRIALVYGERGLDSPGNLTSYEPTLFLHELSHTLGAVQDSAPHATDDGHCYEAHDVMCYRADGGPMQMVCPPLQSAIDSAYDCGGDDYFNPHPAPGSYLATHWNLYNSDFLADCAELPPACQGSAGRSAKPRKRRGRRATGWVRRLRHGKLRGPRLGLMRLRLAPSANASKVRVSGTSLRLGAGRWRIRTCAVTGASGHLRKRCRMRTAVVRRTRKVRPKVLRWSLSAAATSADQSAPQVTGVVEVVGCRSGHAWRASSLPRSSKFARALRSSVRCR